MKKLLGLLVFLVVGLMTVSPAYGETLLRLKGKYWDTELDGKVTAGTSLLAGTKLDLSDTLHLDEQAYIPEVELKLNLFLGKFVASYATASYEGKQTLVSGINFAGISYNANELVNTKLDLKFGSLLYEQTLAPEFITKAFPSIAEAEIGFLVGVKYLSANIEMTSPLRTEDANGAIPLPVAGIFLQVGFAKMIKAEAGAVGFKMTAADIEAESFDAYAEVKVEYFKVVPFGLGYQVRRLSLNDTSDNSFNVDLDISGMYLFATFEF